MRPEFEDDADAPQVQRGVRKSTRRWCRGHVGVEHVTRLEIDARQAAYGPCRQIDSGWWSCNHHVVCTGCGKILDPWPVCPDAPVGVRQWGTRGP